MKWLLTCYELADDNLDIACLIHIYIISYIDVADPSYPVLVEHGKTYLLRIVNAVMNEEMFFGIANHTITVVGQDGAYITPITVDYIMITPGQTMDVLLTANQAPSYYYIVATPFMDHSLNAPFNEKNTSAILMYTEATLPTTIPSPTLPDYDDRDAASNFTSQIKSLNPVDELTDNVTRILITVSVNRLPCTDEDCTNPTRQSASLNNISFLNPPTIDILHSYYWYVPTAPHCFYLFLVFLFPEDPFPLFKFF
jgi:laccase